MAPSPPQQQNILITYLMAIVIVAIMAALGLGTYIYVKKPCWPWVLDIDETYVCVPPTPAPAS